jgi:2-C-methyl-D-erythritol 4-phosphate cytidylyltransferase / 2-C-methyl-D-erythritol 2,4-cyclodiphosphate synthase
MMKDYDLAILVVAAGRGSRAGEGLPKQYRPLAGRPLLAHTLSALLDVASDARILTVIHPDDHDLYEACLAGLDKEQADRIMLPVHGGATRQDSVRAGLEALAGEKAPPHIVLIQDGARPFPNEGLIARARAAALDHGAAVPALLVIDTIKEVNESGRIVATPARAALRAVQTPQAFRFDLILAAHRKAAEANENGLTDDAAIAEWAGHAVHVFEGEIDNMKVTSAEDLAVAERRFLKDLPDVRIGQGYDVHAFGPGDHVWLGGLKIPHDHALVGHSDADVLAHAITDALLGAIGDGDIGSHFPPSDPKWKGAASEIFLAAAAEAVRARGGMIAHIDATIVCERPKIGPHRDAIRESIAKIVRISLDRVAIKATTSERLGFTGREEGMASMALATVRLPL